MYEVPHARMHLQPFTIRTKIAFIAGGFAHGLIGAGAALRGLEGAIGQFPLLPSFIMVATGQAPGGPPVGMGVDPLPLSCKKKKMIQKMTIMT